MSRTMWIATLVVCAAGSAAAQKISTIAGSNFVFPTAPVPAVQAPLGLVSAVAVDPAGNYYIADAYNNLVLKVSASGTLTIVANLGASGLAVDSAGNLFIAVNSQIRMLNTAGVIATVAGNGTAGYSGDGGRATNAELNVPIGIAVDGAGDMFIADSNNNRIRMVNPAGIITTLAGNGTQGYSGDGGLATSAELSGPYDVAVDSAGNLFIADTGNNRVRMVNPAGIIATVAGTGTQGYAGDGGPAMAALLALPWGLAVDAAGHLFIVDSGRIREVSAGIITTVAGNGTYGYSGDGGLATSASMFNPTGVAVDGSGNLLIADSYNERVRKVAKSGIVTTVAGDGAYRYGGDGGPATSALFNIPTAVAVDNAGNVFIADSANIRIRKVSPGGMVTTVAGNGQWGVSADGGLATNTPLAYPAGVAVDSAGNLFFADTWSQRVRMVTPGGVIATVAGGVPGYFGDGGPANSAGLFYPQGIALDETGNLFIADTMDSVIRMVSPAGTISTVAGNGKTGYSGDGGPAASASLNHPTAVAVDSAGNLFIGDSDNNRIRKVTRGGTIATVAGNGTAGYSGDGGSATAAKLNTASVPGSVPVGDGGSLNPGGLAVDGAGNLFIADYYNNRIRKVSPGGTITTVAGDGMAGYAGDGGLATGASLYGPWGVALDSAGNLLIADSANNRVRQVASVTSALATAVSAASGTAPVAPGSIVSIYGSNLATSGMAATSLPLPTNLAGASVSITDSSGATASLPLFYAGPTQINAEIPPTASAGMATLTITTPSGIQTASVMLATVAPGLFAANQDGKGVAAAQLVTNQSNGQQTVADIFNAPCAAGSCAGIPLGVSSGQTALVLYGTGIRNFASLSDVTVLIGSVNLSVFYAGPAPNYAGLDQVNVFLPANLAGSGTVNITVSVSGTRSNSVTATFQ
jgi:uncharacterized protein (TIGR03437 family)